MICPQNLRYDVNQLKDILSFLDNAGIFTSSERLFNLGLQAVEYRNELNEQIIWDRIG
jgi:hypothetical protein